MAPSRVQVTLRGNRHGHYIVNRPEAVGSAPFSFSSFRKRPSLHFHWQAHCASSGRSWVPLAAQSLGFRLLVPYLRVLFSPSMDPVLSLLGVISVAARLVARASRGRRDGRWNYSTRTLRLWTDAGDFLVRENDGAGRHCLECECRMPRRGVAGCPHFHFDWTPCARHKRELLFGGQHEVFNCSWCPMNLPHARSARTLSSCFSPFGLFV